MATKYLLTRLNLQSVHIVVMGMRWLSRLRVISKGLCFVLNEVHRLYMLPLVDCNVDLFTEAGPQNIG